MADLRDLEIVNADATVRTFTILHIWVTLMDGAGHAGYL